MKRNIRKADKNDAATIAAMAVKMWPTHTIEELTAEFSSLLQGEGGVVFIGYEGETPIGFAQCQLRKDYVEGTRTSPVAYLEGVFVEESHRHMDVGRELVLCCERWGAAKGCKEFASDCEEANVASELFHKSIGFSEANRIVCFVKKIQEGNKDD